MERSNMTKAFSVGLVALTLALVLRVFVVEGFVISGDSMTPTMLEGDYVLIYKQAYLRKEPQRGDIIIATPREYPHKVIKRVAGLPGERVDMGDGNKLYIDPQEYYVVGDNREVSIDSKVLGPIDRWDIKGRVFANISIKRQKLIKY